MLMDVDGNLKHSNGDVNNIMMAKVTIVETMPYLTSNNKYNDYVYN